MSVDEAAANYREACRVERFAIRNRQEAQNVLLHTLAQPARFTPLHSQDTKSSTWLNHVDELLERYTFSPHWRKILRQMRTLKLENLKG